MADSSLATTGALRLRDGRSISFAAAGPADGFPVVYCHGAIGSPRWRTPALDSLIEQLGIRYLILHRPGFGGSDHAPGRTVADFARDVEDAMDALGYERFSAVGVSAGAAYALACGWALGHRLAALAAASPLAPPSRIAGRRAIRYRAPLAAFGLPGVGPLAGDLALRTARLRRETGARTMVDDYLVCRRPWGFDPSEVQAPVTLWHGQVDRLVPVAHAIDLASALPACVTHIDPTGGHFFYSRRLADIVGPLVPGRGHGRDRADTLPAAA